MNEQILPFRHCAAIGEPFTATLKGVSNSEDRVWVRRDGWGAIVVDGATSKSGKLFAGRTDGWWAAQLALEAFNALDGPCTARAYVTKVQEAIAAFTKKWPEANPHAVFAAYYRGEIWWVGDCVAVEIGETGQIIREHTTPIAPDYETARVRTEVIRKLEAEGLPPAEVARLGKEAIMPWVRGQVQYANAPEPPFGTIDWTYGVLAQTEVPERFLGSISLHHLTRRIMLHSDGFPFSSARMRGMHEKLIKMYHDNPQCIAQEFPYFMGSSKGFVDETTGEKRDYYDDTSAVELELSALRPE